MHLILDLDPLRNTKLANKPDFSLSPCCLPLSLLRGLMRSYNVPLFYRKPLFALRSWLQSRVFSRFGCSECTKCINMHNFCSMLLTHNFCLASTSHLPAGSTSGPHT